MWHLLLVEVLFELRRPRSPGRRVERIGPSFIAYSSGCDNGDEVVRPLELGKVEAGHPAGRVDGRLQAPFEIGNQARQLLAPRQSIETADGDVDRMDGPAAEHFQQLIAVLLQPQAAFDLVGMIAWPSPARSRSPRKSGACSKMDVQGVAFDPFAAVEQPPQPANLGRRLARPGPLPGVDRAHLIGHRADAADAGRDVGHFFQRAAAQAAPRTVAAARRSSARTSSIWPSLQVDVQPSFALDAGQGLDADCADGRACSARLLGLRLAASRSLSARNSGA